jgi:hypothetical protein
MIRNIIQIAVLCIVVGSASIPISFTINSSPLIVWLGNGLGSLLSAIVVIYIGERITNQPFRDKMSKHRVSKKVVTVFEEGEDNKKVLKARVLIDKHGIRLFGFFCPVFPGVLLSTVAVYVLDLNKKTYRRWMFAGVFFVSGAYVWAYWFTFVRPH